MVRVLSFDVGTKNLALCDMSVESNGAFTVHDWTVTSCVPRGINVNKTPLHELAPSFFKYVSQNVKSWFFNKDGSKKDFARVFIESQPLGGRGAARNLKTKVFSHILQCFCLETAPEVPVVFIHPGLKLKDMPKPAEGRTTYRENKLFAIAETTRYVETDKCQSKDLCTKQYLEKKMKKDDLADAFLQGLLAGGAVARGDVVVSASEEKPKRVKKPEADGTSEAPKKKSIPPGLAGRKRAREDLSEVVATETTPVRETEAVVSATPKKVKKTAN